MSVTQKLPTQEAQSSPSQFNVGSFLTAFVAYAVERWLHQGGLSGAEDLKTGKKKRKKLAKKHPKNFVQSALKEFALAYPDTPREAGGSVKKWLIRQVTDPKKIWLLAEALGAARGVIGKLGEQSARHGKKSSKKGKKKVATPTSVAAIQPLMEAGAKVLGKATKQAKDTKRASKKGKAKPDAGEHAKAA